MDKNLRLYMAELIGTFVLVFISAGVVCAVQIAHPGPPSSAGVVGIALAQGFILAAALAATVPISGGYLNPAITLMLYVYKKFELGKTLGLIFVQLLGAALAGALLRLFWSTRDIALRDAFLGTPHLNLTQSGFDVPGLGTRIIFSGIGIELVLTFIFTFVLFATLMDPRAPRLLGRLGRWLSPLWVGLAMAAIVFVGFSWTGAATNPARYFGTVVWEMSVASLATQHPYGDNVVYWLGPIVGALLAGGAYIHLILPAEEEKAASTTAATGKVTAGAGSTLFRAKR